MKTLAMAAILSSVSVDGEAAVAARFTPYQIEAIYHEHRKELAEKSVRIGYTYAKAFRAGRSSLLTPRLTTLFASKDQETAFEFIRNCDEHLEHFRHARSVVLRETTDYSVPVYSDDGRDTGMVENITVARIVFDNHSRILAFSSNPNALRAYGGNVMWDEAAFHPKGRAMWSAIQGRIRWGYTVDVWSSLSMEDTMFDALAAEAKAGRAGWAYRHVDIHEAVAGGLVELINETRGTSLTREEFVAQAREDCPVPDIFALEYEIRKSNTLSPIVPWETIKACELPGHRIERAHLPDADVAPLFGRAEAGNRGARRAAVERWLAHRFPSLLSGRGGAGSRRYRLGFDVAASRKGNLAAVWVQEKLADGRARHRATLTFQTEDWDVLQWCLEILMARIPGEVVGRGDETGLGRQICWSLEKLHHGRFRGVNFAAAKAEIGTALMQSLSSRGLDLSPDHPDISMDLQCIRKGVEGARVVFFEGKNELLPASHADIGWSAALAAYADIGQGAEIWVLDQTER